MFGRSNYSTPNFRRKIGAITSISGRGRHTTSDDYSGLVGRDPTGRSHGVQNSFAMITPISFLQWATSNNESGIIPFSLFYRFLKWWVFSETTVIRGALFYPVKVGLNVGVTQWRAAAGSSGNNCENLTMAVLTRMTESLFHQFLCKCAYSYYVPTVEWCQNLRIRFWHR